MKSKYLRFKIAFSCHDFRIRLWIYKKHTFLNLQSQIQENVIFYGLNHKNS